MTDVNTRPAIDHAASTCETCLVAIARRALSLDVTDHWRAVTTDGESFHYVAGVVHYILTGEVRN